MIPTSKKEVEALGWDYIDVILFTGDAFVDHPSFGSACIARYLQKAGYRVAVVPQPNWRDDLRDFKKLGVPRLYFGLNSGAMDSMVHGLYADPEKTLPGDSGGDRRGRGIPSPAYALRLVAGPPAAVGAGVQRGRLALLRNGGAAHAGIDPGD